MRAAAATLLLLFALAVLSVAVAVVEEDRTSARKWSKSPFKLICRRKTRALRQELETVEAENEVLSVTLAASESTLAEAEAELLVVSASLKRTEPQLRKCTGPDGLYEANESIIGSPFVADANYNSLDEDFDIKLAFQGARVECFDVGFTYDRQTQTGTVPSLEDPTSCLGSLIQGTVPIGPLLYPFKISFFNPPVTFSARENVINIRYNVTVIGLQVLTDQTARLVYIGDSNAPMPNTA